MKFIVLSFLLSSCVTYKTEMIKAAARACKQSGGLKEYDMDSESFECNKVITRKIIKQSEVD